MAAGLQSRYPSLQAGGGGVTRVQRLLVNSVNHCCVLHSNLTKWQTTLLRALTPDSPLARQRGSVARQRWRVSDLVGGKPAFGGCWLAFQRAVTTDTRAVRTMAL